jgi:1-acyl-sn-glycerol-3-phosphate acyltransferase
MDRLRGWAYSPLARGLRSFFQRVFLFPAMGFVSPATVRGKRHLDALEPPIIVVANHVSHMDTPTVLKVLPGRIRRRLVVAAARDYFYGGRIKGALVSACFATIPFDRGGGSAESMDRCVEILRAGWSLLLFPEGTRSATGQMGRVRHGAAVLAVEACVPVLPGVVHGLASVMPKGSAVPLPGGLVVDIGEVIEFEEGTSVDEVFGRMESALRELADAAPDWAHTTPPDARGAGEDTY